MKRDARIGLAIILVLGLFTTFMVARSLHQRSAEMEQAEAATKQAQPAAASVQAEPDGWTPDTDKPTEPFSDPAMQVQRQELDRYMESHNVTARDRYAAPGAEAFNMEGAPGQTTTGRPNAAVPQTYPVIEHTMSAPEARPAEQVYTIQAGDNPWKISSKLFGDGKYAMKIMAANPGVDPAKLKVGQQIKVPNIEGAAPVAQPATASRSMTQPVAETSAPEVMSAAKTHTVQSGETLAAIAHKYYGSSGPKSIKRLTDANPGLDPRRLKVGASLKVP